MKPIVYTTIATLLLGGCYAVTSHRSSESSATSSETNTTMQASPSHDQQCSALRADIASAQHNQRTVAPGTTAPIIAAASEGKEDQRIEALRQQYAALGCTDGSSPESSSPTH